MPLEIVFENRDNKRIHECNVCNKVDRWTDKWMACEFGIGVGWRGEDRVFLTCSDKCRKEDEEKKLLINYRKKIHDEWWEAYGDLVDPFEKKFKKIFEQIHKEEEDGKWK